jgi:hypothetical protein
VVLCTGFLEQVRAAIAAWPQAALSLFAERGSLTASTCRIAALLGRPWAEVVDNYIPTQGLVLPAGVARGFDAFCTRLKPDDTMDDWALLVYLMGLGVPMLVAVPSLLEQTDAESLMGHEYQGRRSSVCFAGAAADEWDWSAAAAAPDLVPLIHWRTGRSLCLFGRAPGGSDWLRMATDQVLARRGLPEVDVAADLDRAVAAAGLEAETVAAIGPGRLHELWLTALATGVVVAELQQPRRTDSVESLLSAPLVATSLSTMPLGLLWRFVPEPVLTEAGAALGAVVSAATARGLTWAAG